MSAQIVSESNFREIYTNNEMVVLDFWAAWCGPCQQFSPIFEEVSQLYPKIFFGKVDTEVEKKIAGYFAIRSLPTLLVIREELEIFRQPGLIGKEALCQIVEMTHQASMDELRAKIEAEEGQE